MNPSPFVNMPAPLCLGGYVVVVDANSPQHQHRRGCVSVTFHPSCHVYQNVKVPPTNDLRIAHAICTVAHSHRTNELSLEAVPPFQENDLQNARALSTWGRCREAVMLNVFVLATLKTLLPVLECLGSGKQHSACYPGLRVGWAD